MRRAQRARAVELQLHEAACGGREAAHAEERHLVPRHQVAQPPEGVREGPRALRACLGLG